ncbi:MAG: DNA recombination/repair protein RecA, partial [Deinococcota bacterium]|nr:DNA recombination/repair protein RecA [Deinococcota bacterium]
VGLDKVGNRTRVKVTKNKVAAPFREAEVDIMFGKGIDKLGDLISIASDLDIIQKSGSFFKYGGETIGQGKEKAASYLSERPEVIDTIRAQVMAAIKGDPARVGRAGTGDDDGSDS